MQIRAFDHLTKLTSTHAFTWPIAGRVAIAVALVWPTSERLPQLLGHCILSLSPCDGWMGAIDLVLSSIEPILAACLFLGFLVRPLALFAMLPLALKIAAAVAAEGWIDLRGFGIQATGDWVYAVTYIGMLMLARDLLLAGAGRCSIDRGIYAVLKKNTAYEAR